MLDVGSGDGVRAARLAAAKGIKHLVLSDPSERMLVSCREQLARVWAKAAEDLPDAGERFDVITCLWNVLGLVADSTKRLAALERMSRLLANQGQLFLDVNNRYNASSYGWAPTIRRMAYDLVSPADSNGDVAFTWRVDDREIQSTGHVFRPGEVKKLIKAAGLAVRHAHIIDYKSGALRRCRFAGQLFFELATRVDS